MNQPVIELLVQRANEHPEASFDELLHELAAEHMGARGSDPELPEFMHGFHMQGPMKRDTPAPPYGYQENLPDGYGDDATFEAVQPRPGLFSGRFWRKMGERCLTAFGVGFFSASSMDDITSALSDVELDGLALAVEHALLVGGGAALAAAGVTFLTRFRGDPDSGSFTRS